MLRSASIKADRGPGSSGMVNTCERSLNVVTQNEPKMLTGSSQNGTVAGRGCMDGLLVDTQRYRRIRADLTHPGI